ncbi:BTAD domain-containing putative transcriptional regulator [Ruania zhangjianzhongii]|uniref:BTAD domain-containing putative transcriptional regulator n=1 Tax=Ruania zhangjianzhongii TaxID=2603206 RepID=UPI0011C7AFC6|nr:BTAD domain-containing putative transcriptional regulator [Ruania zhangjianzhongii]
MSASRTSATGAEPDSFADVRGRFPAVGEPPPSANTVPPRVTGLHREPVLRRLDPVAQGHLGLVVAPAGSGKTTLMAQWARASGLPVAWCRLDSTAVAGRLVDWLWPALSVHLRGDVERPASVDALVRVLHERSGELLLVIDDLHVIAETPAARELERFVLLGPGAVKLLLGSRTMPAVNLTRSELPPLVVLTGEDLRFRTWEVEKLFRNVYRAPLPPYDVAALTRYTQGWAAGLQLFHLSTVGHQGTARRRAVDALAGHSRFAQHYLSAQVLATLPEATQDFLVQTSVFDDLTAARCDELLGITGSQRILRDLVDRQALTTTLDGGVSFHYHDVLRRHLESVLREELGAQATHEWYRRAAAVLEAEHATVEALRARARAEDWEGVQRLLREHGHRIMAGPTSAHGAGTWTTLLPAWLTETDPWCALAEARRLLNDGQLRAAETVARRAREQFTDDVGLRVCDQVIADVSVWVDTTPPPRPTWVHLLRAALRRDPLAAARQARRLDGPGARLTEGLALWVAGNRRQAWTVLRSLAAYGDPDEPAQLAAQLALATISGVGTRPVEDTVANVDDIAAEASRRGWTWIARIATGLTLAVGPPRSRQALAEVLAEHEARSDRVAAAFISMAGAIAQVRGDSARVSDLTAVALRLRELDCGSLAVWCDAIASLKAAAHDLPDAEQMARAAEGQARRAAVPGAACFAYSALVLVDTENSAEELTLARSTAIEIGLAIRPWEWFPAHQSARSRPAERPAAGLAAAERPPAASAAPPSPPEHPPAPSTAAAATTPSSATPGADTPGAATPSSATPGADTPMTDTPPAGIPAAPSPSSPGTGVRVDLRCFGGFELRVHGRSVDLSGVRPRVRALLKFLGIHAGHPVHRELITDALWGELDAEAGMRSFQVSLSQLRAVLEPGVPGRRSRIIQRVGEAYRLNLSPDSRSDVFEFEVALGEAKVARLDRDQDRVRQALTRALDAYQGDLFSEEGAPAWVLTPRERLRAGAAEAAAQLAELEFRAERWTAAVSAAQRSIDIDPYRDDAWRAQVAALRRAGEPAAAQRALRAYRAVLAELGVDSELTGL